MKRDDKRKLKLCVLNKVKSKRGVLFGAFSDRLSKRDKTIAWDEIYKYALSLQAVPAGKDGAYMRDVWWPNVRKLSVEKYDNARKTGTGKVPEGKFTEVDETVRDIIGRDSPVVEGIAVTESMEPQNDITELGQFTKELQKVNFPEEEELVELEQSSNKSASGKKAQQALTTNSLEKHALQLELLKLQIYKTKLEARQLEMNFGLPRSEYTQDIPVDIIDV